MSRSLPLVRVPRCPEEVGGIVALALLSGNLLLEHRRRQPAEMQVRHHLAMMAHEDRVAAMGQLTTSLAHELNQALGAILRNSEAARNSLDAMADTPTSERRLSVATTTHDGHVDVAVRDKGRGIAQAALADILNPDEGATIRFTTPVVSSRG